MSSARSVQLALIVLDFFMVSVASVLAIVLRNTLPMFTDDSQAQALIAPVALLTIPTWLLLLMAFGAYSIDQLGAGVREYKSILVPSLVLAAIVAQAAFLFRYSVSRGYYVMLIVFGTALLLIGRYAARRLLQYARRHGRLQTRTLLLGHARQIDALVTVLRREAWTGYGPVGALTPNREPVRSADLPILGTPDDVRAVAVETRAHAIVFAEGSFGSSVEFRRLAWELEDSQLQLIVAPTLADISAERLDVRPVGGLPLVFVERPQAIEASRWVKRVFDLVGAAFSLILATPAMIIAAIAIKLEDRGPILFRQERTGRHGIAFGCYKFRSMVTNAEELKATLAGQNESDGVLFKMANDPRITRVGRFIRRFSIDELPQLFNVLAGQMSLVGPRPALPSEVSQYSDDVARRLHVRPGMTGLWQVSGRSDLSWEETVRLDLYYVDNWSLLQDLNILAKTAGAVLRPNGAY